MPPAALLLPKPEFMIIAIVLFAQGYGDLLEAQSARPGLLPLRPWLRNLELLVSFMVIVMVLYALRHDRVLVLRPRTPVDGRRRQLPLPALLPPRPRRRNLELLVPFRVIVMVLYAGRHRSLQVLPPQWGQGSRRAGPPPPALLLPRRRLRTVVLAMLFMIIGLTL